MEILGWFVTAARFVWSVSCYTVFFCLLFIDESLTGKIRGSVGVCMKIVAFLGAATVCLGSFSLLLPSGIVVSRCLAVVYIAEMLVYLALLSYAYIKNNRKLYGDTSAEFVIEGLLYPISAFCEAVHIMPPWRSLVCLVVGAVGSLVGGLLIGRSICSTLNVPIPVFLLNNVGWGWIVAAYVAIWMICIWILQEPDEEAIHFES